MFYLILLLLLCSVLVLILINKNSLSNISKIIIVAFLARVTLMIIGNYFFTLPDSTQDASGFENKAWLIARSDFVNILGSYPGYNSNFLSWILSFIYYFFGRNILIAQTMGIFFGVGSVLLGWIIAKKVWDEGVANKIGWTIALFPSLILYSVLTLREVYSSFFLLLAIFGLVNWNKNGSNYNLLLSIFAFIAAMHFHGVLIAAGIIVLIVISYNSLIKSLQLIIDLKINILLISISTLSLYILVLIFSNKIYIPYISTFEDVPNLAWLSETISARMRGDATYSDWLNINSLNELFYKTPIRMAFFLFAPFPWDIIKLSHLIGMFDGILYMILSYFILMNIKVIWKNSALRLILLILVLYIILFSLGVSNFGAGIRHRSKFVIEMILLAGPLIPRFYLCKIKLLKFKNLK